jgi:parallel beta-helix repeat protein
MITSAAATGSALATQNEAQGFEISPLPELETSGVIRANSDAELATVSDYGSGTVADPYVIENKRIDATGQGAGIYVRNTTKALIIRNCWVSNAVYVDSNWGPGANIMVYSSGPCIIENNRCDNSSSEGLKLSLTNSMVSNNTVWGTQNGINLISATYCTIDNNTITGTSWTGIAVIMVSEFNTISNNTITNCNRGIGLESQGNYNLVRDNLITGGNYGVKTNYGSNNDIIKNILLRTNNEGVSLDPVGSIGNTIINNAFIGCNSGNPQAYDSLSNLWNGSASGNYWHDHISPDSDYNRIVDVPYAIGGSGGNYDYYPMTSTLRIIDPADRSTEDSSTVTLSGTLLNPYNIASFTWYNYASSQTGNCSGLHAWTAEVPLWSGENEITVTMGIYMVISTATTSRCSAPRPS